MTDQIETEKDVISKSEKFMKIMFVVVVIALGIALLIIKLNNDSFKWIWAILSYVGIIIFFAVVYFGVIYFGKSSKTSQDEENLITKPISIEEARAIAKNATKNPEYAEYLIDCKSEEVQQRGKTRKNDIYISKWTGYYTRDDYYVLINMNYPLIRRTILINPKDIQLEQAKMLLASEEFKNFKEIKIANPTLGIEQTITEPVKDEEKEKKEDEKDL